MNRRYVSQALLLLAVPISACEGKPMSVSFEVVLFSYLDRPIFDVLVNGSDIGVSSAYPVTGGGTVMGFELKTGPVKVSWRLDGPEGTPRNGETIHAKNTPVLENVERKYKYMGVHILPDDTVEIALSEQYPSRSTLAVEMYRQRHGK